MTKRLRELAGICILILLVLSFYYAFFSQGKQKNDLPSKEDTTEAIQEMAERAYKKAYLGPLIATYEKVLISAPDSLDTRKKLVKAYLEIGDTAKARPLLEQLSKSSDADAALYQKQLESLPQ